MFKRTLHLQSEAAKLGFGHFAAGAQLWGLAMLVLGDRKKFDGDVTTLNWIGPRPASSIEKAVGYGQGRLAAGYWVLLLVDSLTPDDFKFSGTTLRSGGRAGLPADTPEADAARTHVSKTMIREHGKEGYRKLQEQVLRSVAISGAQRITKVLPDTRHDKNAKPSEQYPMGGGGLQWTLVVPKNFLVAMHVSADGTATTPHFSVSLAEDQPYQQLMDHRGRVMRYLEGAASM